MTAVRPQWRLQDRITRARVEAGLQKQELAERLGVSAKTVGYWELGQHAPRRRDLIAIAQVTGVDLDWLTGDEDSGIPPLGRSGDRLPLNWADYLLAA